MEEPPNPPRVTALIVSYNNAAALRRSIQALERSAGREALEILVVDNGSQDECPRLDAVFPGVVFLRLPRNFGKTKALNIGMRTAAAELIFFLEPEVEVQPETVSALADKLDADSEAAAVCPLVTDQDGAVPPQVFRLPAAQALYGIWKGSDEFEAQEIDLAAARQVVEYAPFQALLVRKYFLKGLNYLDGRYGESGADLELAFQIRRAGRKILILPGVKAVRSASPAVVPSAAARSLVSADLCAGYAGFLSKHYGFASGLWFRIRAALSALLAFRFASFIALLSGQKIDGSQSIAL
jgi:GT2 family glycosyltransferase